MKTWIVKYTVDPLIVSAETREEAIEEAAGLDTPVHFYDCEELEQNEETKTENK